MYSKSTEEEVNGENFDKKSITQLLKLGTKIKLIDLDLTDYFRLTCEHLQPLSGTNESLTRGVSSSHASASASCHDQEPNEMKKKDSLTYLERRFEEIFLRRFHVLPGFNDLFVFTSLMKTAAYSRGGASTGLGDSGSDGGLGSVVGETLVEESSNHLDLEEDDENIDDADSDEFDAEQFDNYASETDASSNFDDEPENNGGVVDSESELTTAPTVGFYDDSDTNEPQVFYVKNS